MMLQNHKRSMLHNPDKSVKNLNLKKVGHNANCLLLPELHCKLNKSIWNNFFRWYLMHSLNKLSWLRNFFRYQFKMKRHRPFSSVEDKYGSINHQSLGSFSTNEAIKVHCIQSTLTYFWMYGTHSTDELHQQIRVFFDFFQHAIHFFYLCRLGLSSSGGFVSFWKLISSW